MQLWLRLWLWLWLRLRLRLWLWLLIWPWLLLWLWVWLGLGLWLGQQQNLIFFFIKPHLQTFVQTYGELFGARPADDSLILADARYRLVELAAHRGRPGPSVGINLAYAMHTSGTTGTPKVVRVPHQSIVPNVTHLR